MNVLFLNLTQNKDNKVHIYQIENNQFKETQTLQERDFITAVKYSNNDEYLAVADNAKNVKCYKIDSASYSDITRDLWQHHAGRITSMAWSPDSNYLATSSVDTHCFIYSPSKVMSFIQVKSKIYLQARLDRNKVKLELTFYFS